MKKIVTKTNLDVMTTDELKDDEIYALYVDDMDLTLIIIFTCDLYITTSLYSDGLQEWCYEANSLKEIIEEILHDGHEVFNFEDEYEFCNWILRRSEKT